MSKFQLLQWFRQRHYRLNRQIFEKRLEAMTPLLTILMLIEHFGLRVPFVPA
tara:strand:+ start:497 stop:652 length:156 start_codon:yes stop_codon:yes gene_type:complete